MSELGRRRNAESRAEEDTASIPVEANAKSDRRRHRAAYPTPGFKAFAALLNIFALPLASLLLTNSEENTIGIFALCLLTLIGVGITIYSTILRPLPDNIQKRKILAGVTAGFGFFLLVALGTTVLLGF